MMTNVAENSYTNYSPKFIYGSERKMEYTAFAIQEAINIGFRAIDTANCCSYLESEVGVALERLYSQGYKRSDFWLQSKFTFMYPWFLDLMESNLTSSIPGYNHELDLEEQINQSLNHSLAHLHTNYLDSYILHGGFEFSSGILYTKDIEAWGILEKLHRSGKIKAIGVSNYNLKQISDLTEVAEIKPMVIQNYFGVGLNKWFGKGADEQYEILKFCKENNIEYQGFLNEVSEDKEELVSEVANAHNVSEKQIAFRFGLSKRCCAYDWHLG